MAALSPRRARYAVRGMTCAACVRQVERALDTVPGVAVARVDLASGTATVEGDFVSFERLRAAVEDAGYDLVLAGPLPAVRMALLRPFVIGPLASLALLGVYLGLIALAEGWDHALQQFEQDRPFVLALVAGFGAQAGLFATLRACRGVGPGMAASTGTSTAAMLACCAHYLADVLPILGVSAAAAFLATFKAELLWLGVLMNLGGIGYMLWQLRARRAGLPATLTKGASCA